MRRKGKAGFVKKKIGGYQLKKVDFKYGKLKRIFMLSGVNIRSVVYMSIKST